MCLNNSLSFEEWRWDRLFQKASFTLKPHVEEHYSDSDNLREPQRLYFWRSEGSDRALGQRKISKEKFHVRCANYSFKKVENVRSKNRQLQITSNYKFHMSQIQAKRVINNVMRMLHFYVYQRTLTVSLILLRNVCLSTRVVMELLFRVAGDPSCHCVITVSSSWSLPVTTGQVQTQLALWTVGAESSQWAFSLGMAFPDHTLIWVKQATVHQQWGKQARAREYAKIPV